MKSKISLFSLLMFFVTGSAFAGWQYYGYYMRDGTYDEDGSRFIFGIQGGWCFVRANM